MRIKISSLLVMACIFSFVVSHSFAQTEESNTDEVLGTRSAVISKPVKNPKEVKNMLKAVNKTFLETLKENRQVASQAAVIKRNKFKTFLARIKDTRKKEIAERIDQRISQINQDVTDKLGQVIERLQAILAKIETRSADLKSQGKDVAALDTSIQEAKTALESAQTSVSLQAGKQYIVNATSEASLKNDFGQTVSTFRQDLKDVHKIVVDSKQAVRKAATELAKIANLSGINNPVATGSGM